VALARLARAGHQGLIRCRGQLLKRHGEAVMRTSSKGYRAGPRVAAGGPFERRRVFLWPGSPRGGSAARLEALPENVPPRNPFPRPHPSPRSSRCSNSTICRIWSPSSPRLPVSHVPPKTTETCVLMTENSASSACHREPARPETHLQATAGLNEISVLSKSYYVRSLSRDKAVIRRMAVEG
jgi:hypothetical protein